MVRRRLGALAGVIAWGWVCAWAASAAGPGGAAAAETGVNLEVTEAHLGSEDFAEREAGQRELEKVAPEQIEMLRKRAEAAASEEVRARLFTRIKEMEAYLAIHPTGFTLDLKDATIAEVAAAVNKQAGEVILKGDGAQAERSLFTIKGENLSFGELIQCINEQHAVYVDPGGQTLTARLLSKDPGITNLTVTGGMLVNARVQPAHTFAGGMMQEMPWLEVSLNGQMDPRIRVVTCSRSFELDEAVDDRKNNLATAKGPLEPERGPVLGWASVDAAARLGTPDPEATKIARLKGKLHITMAVETQKIVLEDAAANVNKPIETAHGRMTMQRAPGRIPAFEIRPAWMDMMQGPPAEKGRTAQVKVINARGELVSSWCLEGTGSTGMGGAAPGAGPLKVEIYVPIKTVEVTLPVEVKDVPLPAHWKGPQN